MHRFIEGIKQFQNMVFPGFRRRFEKLAEGQRPPALFITCSDSRIVPHLVTQTAPGELFVLRNAGNLVPPYEDAPSGEAATIEYAVQVLQVEEIIVCGHSHCGAISALLNPTATSDLPAVRQWLKHADRTKQLVSANGSAPQYDADPVTNAVMTNIGVQLEHLRTYPSIRDACDAGTLSLHGWFYRFETGEITMLDEQASVFAAIPTDFESSRVSA